LFGAAFFCGGSAIESVSDSTLNFNCVWPKCAPFSQVDLGSAKLVWGYPFILSGLGKKKDLGGDNTPGTGRVSDWAWQRLPAVDLVQ